MGEIVSFRTPTGDRSSIGLERPGDGQVALQFRRALGEGEPSVRSETIVRLTDRQARQLAEAILQLVGREQ